MRDQGINAVYISLDNNLNIQTSEISFSEVFNTNASNEELYFGFEQVYEPYENYVIGALEGIDLVVRHDDQFLRPLEIKLTVIPDNSTHRKPEEEWGPELVIRPVTTTYCALGMMDACGPNQLARVRQLIEPTAQRIENWSSSVEIRTMRDEIVESLDNFQRQFSHLQRPFLIQPIWKTQGKSLLLSDEHALDIFVWSDHALCRLFLDRATEDKAFGGKVPPVSRYMRSAAWLARILYEISTRGNVNVTQVYNTMAYGAQTDKGYAVNGRITSNYMNSERRYRPLLSREHLQEIILHGGEMKLSPERRFDQSVFVAAMLERMERQMRKESECQEEG